MGCKTSKIRGTDTPADQHITTDFRTRKVDVDPDYERCQLRGIEFLGNPVRLPMRGNDPVTNLSYQEIHHTSALNRDSSCVRVPKFTPDSTVHSCGDGILYPTWVRYSTEGVEHFEETEGSDTRSQESQVSAKVGVHVGPEGVVPFLNVGRSKETSAGRKTFICHVVQEKYCVSFRHRLGDDPNVTLAAGFDASTKQWRNSFVSAAYVGGMLAFRVECEADGPTKAALEAGLKLDIGPTGGKGELDYGLTSAKGGESIHVTSRHVGGEWVTKEDGTYTLAELLKVVHAWKESIDFGNAAVVRLKLTPYEDIGVFFGLAPQKADEDVERKAKEEATEPTGLQEIEGLTDETRHYLREGRNHGDGPSLFTY